MASGVPASTHAEENETPGVLAFEDRDIERVSSIDQNSPGDAGGAAGGQLNHWAPARTATSATSDERHTTRRRLWLLRNTITRSHRGALRALAGSLASSTP